MQAGGTIDTATRRGGDDVPSLIVRAIRAETAARNAAWILCVKGRLREGNATTKQLADACGLAGWRRVGIFRSLITRLEHDGAIARAGQCTGPHGHINIIWKLPEVAA